jgi:type I restriction enzyme S subunit
MNLKYKKYDNYKPSGVEWLGDVPQHWEVKPLFSMSKLKSETNFTDLELLSVYLNKGVIRFKDVEQKRTNVTSKDLSKYQLVEKGDFVLNNQQAWRGSVGVSNYKGIISPAYLILSLSDIINPNFANYSFRNGGIIKQFLIGSRGVGTIQRNLYWSELKRVMVNVPPKPEQTAIANFLDRKTAQIDKAIAQKGQLIELLKERRQILIHEAVTQGLDKSVEMKDSGVEWIGEVPKHWEVKKLKYVAEINKYSLDEDTNKDFEFSYVDIGSVTFENGIENIENYIFKKAPSRARRLANTGDTIISTVRTYLKSIDYISKEKSSYIYSTGFAILTPKAFIYPQYLSLAVKDDGFTNQVTISSKGMSYPAINSTDLSRLLIIQPPFKEQQEIVNYIETQSQKIKTAISLKQQEIAALKEYKTVLIDAAVTGKVVVD